MDNQLGFPIYVATICDDENDTKVIAVETSERGIMDAILAFYNPQSYDCYPTTVLTVGKWVDSLSSQVELSEHWKDLPFYKPRG